MNQCPEHLCASKTYLSNAQRVWITVILQIVHELVLRECLEHSKSKTSGAVLGVEHA